MSPSGLFPPTLHHGGSNRASGSVLWCAATACVTKSGLAHHAIQRGRLRSFVASVPVGATSASTVPSGFVSSPAAPPLVAPATAPSGPPRQTPTPPASTTPTGPATTAPTAAPAAEPATTPPPIKADFDSRSVSSGVSPTWAAGVGSWDGTPCPGTACSARSGSTGCALVG